MRKNSQALADSLLSSSFIAVVFSFSGWALLEAWLLLMHASGRGQLTGAIAGLILVFLSMKHSSHYLRGPVDDKGLKTAERHNFRRADIGYAFFLFGTGNLVGTSIVYGGMLLLAALIVPLCFAPWSRIPFCRNHFFSACTMIWAGIALALYIGRHAIDPMLPGIASWLFWTCTSFLLLLKAEKLWQNQRGAKRVASASKSQV